MKHVSTLLFAFLLSPPSIAQQALPEPTPESVNLRLELAAVEMDRAAEYRTLATWMLVGGSLFAVSDRINNRDGSLDFAIGVMSFSFATYVGLNSVAVSKDRKAARLLRHQ